MNKKSEVIFRQAIAYSAGAMAINRMLIIPLLPLETFPDYEPLSYIMCLSFSIELYFKSLLVMEGKKVEGHDYSKLFEKLTTEVQEKIEEQWVKSHKGT